LLGAFLTLNHPNRQPRLMFSWLPTGWALAGVGAAMLLPPFAGRLRLLRPALGAAVVAAVAFLHLPAAPDGRPTPAGGPRPGEPSLLDLSDAFVSDIGGCRKTGLLCEVPLRFQAEWALAERRHGCGGLECPWGGFGPPGQGNRDGFVRWLRDTDCDALVSIE